jgi:hypothetical protein
MSLGRVGMATVGVAVMLFAIAIGIGLRGGTVFVGGSEVGGLALTASLAVGAVGCAALGISGSAPFDRRGARLGLGSLACGLGCNLVSGILAANSTVDPLESLPILALSGVGTVAVLIGVVVTVASLARSSRS